MGSTWGDGETMKLIEKLFKKRGNKGPDMVLKNSNILKVVLTRSKLFDTSKTRQELVLNAFPGTASFMKVVADLAVAHQETFDTVTNLMFASFADPYFAGKQCWGPSAQQAMDKTSQHLLQQLPCQGMSGQAIANLIALLGRNGHLRKSHRQPMSNVLARLGQDEQVKVSNGLKNMDPSQLMLVAGKGVLMSFIGDSRAAVCKRLLPVLNTVDAETRTFLVHEMFGDSD